MNKWISVFLLFAIVVVNAQVQQVIYKTQDYSQFGQLTLYAGYDHPLESIDSKYIEYKGNLMTGISYNHYWNNWGLQADMNYGFSRPKSSLNTPLAYTYRAGQNGQIVYEQNSVMTITEEDYSPLKKFFIGVGPSYKFQSKNEKTSFDVGVMGGLGLVQGGTYLQYGFDPSIYYNNIQGSYTLLNYNSGFDRQSVFAVKGNIRFNYFYKPDFGLFVGAYYLNHFGVKESGNNKILNDYGFTDVYGEPVSENVYNIDANITEIDPPINGESRYFGGYDNSRTESQNNAKSYDLSSIGIVAGISWKFNKQTTSTRCPKGYTLCPNDGLCYLEGNCGKVEQNNLIVKLVDQQSGQVIPDAQVNVIHQNDQKSIGIQNTKSNGSVEFNNLQNDDYIIEASLGNGSSQVQLPSVSVKEVEFNNTGQLEKTIYYNNPNFIVNGMAKDCNSGKSLANTKVRFLNSATLESVYAQTDKNGAFNLLLPPANYVVEIEANNFLSERIVADLQTEKRNTNPVYRTEVCAQELDCNTHLKFNNLLFNLNDYHLTPNSTSELDALAVYLEKNPSVRIEISSYTDSRGSNAYNQKLSQERAQETVNYLINKGISPSRLQAKGYGESQLLNNCSDGVECSEAEHAINRRTEFRVLCE